MAAGDKKTVVMKVCGKVPDAGGNVPLAAEDVVAAPGGFGLGGQGKQLTSADDLNNIWENGWYLWGSNIPQNAPIMTPDGGAGYIFMRVTNWGSSNVLQEYWSLNQASQNQARRINRNGTWTPLEWTNPPMLLGVEYRTTERYKGKPVYARLLEVTGFGTPGTIAEVSVDVGNPLDNLVSYSAQIEQWAFPTFMYGGGSGNPLNSKGNIQIEVRTTVGGTIEIYLYSESRDMSGKTCYVQVKYTKAND